MKLNSGFIIVFSTLVFLYLILRAAHIPFVHDEAETFFIYIVSGEYLPYEGFIAANNHFLNSFLGHLCFKFFGPSTLSIRIPNLLFFPIYCIYAYKFHTRITNKFLGIATALALLSAPFFIEFFALARGYGMAMAMTLAFLYHFYRYLDAFHFKHLALAQLYLLIGLLASLTILHLQLLFIGLNILVFIDQFSTDQSFDKWKKLLFSLTLGLPIVVFTTLYVLFLGEHNELVVGSLDGLYVETILPLAKLLTMQSSEISAYIFMVISLLIGAFLLVRMKEKSFLKAVLNPKNLCTVLFFGSLGIIAVSGYVFKIPFPRDRAAMFLFPLLVLSIAFTLEQMKNSVLSYTIGSLLIFFPISLISSANLTHSMYWRVKRVTDEYYNHIQNHSRPNEIATIGGLSLRETTWYHKIFQADIKLNPLYIENPESDLSTDFKIITDNINPNLLEYYQKVISDPVSGNHLFIRKNFLERNLIYTEEYKEYKGNSMYYNLLDINPLKNRIELDPAVLIDFNLELLTNDVSSDFNLVAQYFEGDLSLGSQGIRLNRIKFDWSKFEKNEMIMTIGKLPPGCDRIVVFIFNKHEDDFELRSGKVKIYNLVRDF